MAQSCFLLSSLHGCPALPFTNARGPHSASEGIIKRDRRHKKTQRTSWFGEVFLVSFFTSWDKPCQGKAETVKWYKWEVWGQFRQSSQMDHLKKWRGSGSRAGCGGGGGEQDGQSLRRERANGAKLKGAIAGAWSSLKLKQLLDRPPCSDMQVLQT